MSGGGDVAAYRRLPSEAQMEEAVRELVGRRGGRVWHLRDARAAPELADLPDLIVVCPPRVALVELKSQRRAVSAGQREVAALLATCAEVLGGIVRPAPRAGEHSYDALLAWLMGGR